ncbi:MAG: photosynthetic complex assembly protein PuhC [Betaproteobacteria bacterium]|jgi:putative photosynthetic complex assembly protein|nr:photosynthetic complex assembly protein PuhC [Betaproteobacteria bacterium]NBP44744.1 photosynthetic complex assembly protein PuhC [Betaproteobacteria bacterium]
MSDSNTLPKTRFNPVALAGLLLVLIVGMIAMGKHQRDEAPHVAIEVRQERALHFSDGPQGEVLVIDARQNETIDALYGEQGFLRQTLRALVRERLRRGLDQSEPFWLQQLHNHHLALFDPVTQTRIDLMAFGPSNSQVFARWLDSPSQP